MDGSGVDRRQVIIAGAAAALGTLSTDSSVLAQGGINPDKGVTAPEDLMKEHGVLNRCLLIYEEGLRRLGEGQEIHPNAFLHTAQLIRHFVEEYHEKNEETYIFPQFRRAHKLTDLVQTLLTQHRAGRRLTDQIIRVSQPDAFKEPANREKLETAIRAFIRMYRPHEAREDTVLFPALRTIMTPQQVASLGDRMEEDEQKVLGHEGFERSVAQVTAMEKALGIYELAQFTPKV